ncbi:ubiquitin carboxyl-terminal hydrolase domain containing protein [Entamoeba histolytica HM-1:IMSS-B]|uniref:Ubiquitin carboxyl-terminal hydrolase, putative n=6 Tax=Entamoeba histolytica TaxID=5759 RepID=C4M3Y7_ENTH1|nr:ubiquitin carboxyl-terminal hydrolase, putative [Entamoeba histolytica HM-1:IMSS]EMD46090.1 ubiquitin carboxylterminal hydrolase, putative [Entamoeba histolytica KU27]EMH72409.1 ubiquitin carboxyl-terminal hydrolase domain containing protein [Entamoeba histolytica HM-1:IMSS-B]EMS11139.1 ubiquitin carboxyl-terminal hydrolase, putative [Entamoeba histolytica HM-3:IMSS]ENY64065.1 ubiquitin carboxyl-terminal hydrolase, putative [Entamoeba histolytica HM-1:IMSS-A]GAT96054.1 ubiquitin carboxyl-te|eukprot:XP_652683.1 ubiquitin carboxyl-terminal hydrolase, putative [Entamoeba histolytica HM-1:IMSS]
MTEEKDFIVFDVEKENKKNQVVQCAFNGNESKLSSNGITGNVNIMLTNTDETDTDVEEMNYIVKKISEENYFYYMRSEYETFLLKFTTTNMKKLSDQFYKEFVNKNIKVFFNKIKKETMYTELILKFITFYLNLFFSRIELVDEEGWKLFGDIFNYEEFKKSKTVYNIEKAKYIEEVPLVVEFIIEINKIDGFNKIYEMIRLYDLKLLNSMLTSVSYIFSNDNMYLIEDQRTEIAKGIFERMQELDCKTCSIQLIKSFISISEHFLCVEYIDYIICCVLVKSLNSFDQRMTFFTSATRLLKKLTCEWVKEDLNKHSLLEEHKEDPFKTQNEIVELFIPCLSILNESIQKQILITALPIFDFLSKHGKKSEIFERYLMIIGSGHISIVEVIIPVFKSMIEEELNDETFSLVISTLRKVEDKTIGHFELFCDLVEKKVSLLNELFDLFINKSDIEISQMSTLFSKVIQVTEDNPLFNELINKIKEFIDNSYKEEKSIIFCEAVFALLIEHSQSRIFIEKGINEIFMKVITDNIQLEFTNERKEIVGGALNVLLGMSLIDIELPLTLFSELWEVFMNQNTSQEFKSQLFLFFNNFFSKDSEAKELALCPLDEHLHNDDEIILFDSSEGVQLIKVIIEEVNKEALIKNGEGYKFNGNLNDIAHLVPLKRLLIITNNKVTEEKAMDLLVSIVKSVPVQVGWRVVIEWIKDINQLYSQSHDDKLKKEQVINLKVLNALLIEWTSTSEGKAISHVRSLKGKPMIFNVIIKTGEKVIMKNQIKILSSLSIGEMKKRIEKEFKIDLDKSTIEIDGVDDFDETTSISDLLLQNESEIVVKMAKEESDNSLFRSNEFPSSQYYKKEVSMEDVKTLVEMTGVSKQIAYCALKKYLYYSNAVDLACSALFDDIDSITAAYTKDLENGEIYDIPDDDEVPKKEVDLSFIKLVSDSDEIITIVECLKKHFGEEVEKIVWKIMMSLPSFSGIMKKVNSCFGMSELYGPKGVFNLLTEQSDYTLLYTLQLVDKILFPEKDNENSTTTDTIKSQTLLREIIVKSQPIFDQICLAFRSVLRRESNLIVDIVEMFSKIFSFFIHKLCKHQQLTFNVTENHELFDECFDIILKNPNNPHISGVFISISSSVCELRNKGSSINVVPDLHDFLIQYFNSQQKYDDEQVITISFITSLVNFYQSNSTLLYDQTQKLMKDLFNALELYGTKRAIYFYTKTICLLIESINENIIDFQEVFDYVIQKICTVEPNEQFTDDSDYYITGLLKIAKLLLPKVEIIPEKIDLTISKVFNNCYGNPLKYKLKSVRNSSYDLINTVFTICPNLIKMFSTEVFDKCFQYKVIKKLDIVPKTSRTGYRGIRNIGSTCYINSILQQLFMMKEFREKILRIVSTDTMKVTKQLQKLFISLKGGSQDCYSADSLIDEIQKHKKMYDLKVQQHDACDFLIMLLDCLEDEMNKGSQQQIFPIFTLQTVIQTDSLDSTVKENRETKEEFRTLPLPIQGKRNVGQCLSNFFKPEFFKGDNRLKTDDGRYFNAVKQYKIESLPHYLFLQLNRFDSFDVNVMKINDKCEVPLTLDLSKYMKNKNLNGEYHLNGVVIHTGNAGYGHYFSYILNDGKWIEFNDSRVSYISCDMATRNMNGGYKDFGGYLLVYEKKGYQEEQNLDQVGEDILKELKAEEERISNDVMYHDNQCLKLILKQSKLFDPTVMGKAIMYCFRYAFSLLDEGEQNNGLVDQIIEGMTNYNNPEIGKKILEDAIKNDFVSLYCITSLESIRTRASRLITTVIRWVAENDSVVLFSESEILYKFYQYLRSLLIFSRSYPKNLKQYFILFDALASIGPQACYSLSKMGLIKSFWYYFLNKNEFTEKNISTIVLDVFPDLKYFVTTLQKVICSCYTDDHNKQITPFSNTQNSEYLDNSYSKYKNLIFSSDLLLQLIAYNYDSGCILLKHISYNNFDESLNIINQFKEYIHLRKHENELSNFFNVFDELLMMNDDYSELRAFCLFSPYTNKQRSSLCGNIPQTMTNGLLKKFNIYSPSSKLKLSFIIRMSKKLPYVKQMLLENTMVLEKMINYLNQIIRTNYHVYKENLSEQDFIGYGKYIIQTIPEETKKEIEFQELTYLLELVDERSSMSFDINALEQEIKETKEELKPLKEYQPTSSVPTKVVSDSGYFESDINDDIGLSTTYSH